jgi:hypothetical protein
MHRAHLVRGERDLPCREERPHACSGVSPALLPARPSPSRPLFMKEMIPHRSRPHPQVSLRYCLSVDLTQHLHLDQQQLQAGPGGNDDGTTGLPRYGNHHPTTHLPRLKMRIFDPHPHMTPWWSKG